MNVANFVIHSMLRIAYSTYQLKQLGQIKYQTVHAV